MQKRMEPSFLVTNNIGDNQGLVLGSMISFYNILSNSFQLFVFVFEVLFF